MSSDWGGRFAVGDVIADSDMDEATRRDTDQWTGCIAGALTRDEYEGLLSKVGFGAVEVSERIGYTSTPFRPFVRAVKPH